MAKDKAKAIRCLIDATDIPPSAFALPDDGRKQKHLCMLRKVLFAALARHANADGSSCFPSKSTLKKSTELSLRTIGRLFADLRELGVLEAGDLHAFYKTRVWKLNVPETESDSGKETESDSQRPSQIRIKTESDSQGSVSDSQVREPGSPESGSHTALSLPPIEPPNTPKRASENLDSYKQLAKWLPDDMMAAQKKRGEREQIDVLISEHGGAKFLAALRRHWELQDPESKLACKWTSFLENFDGWLDKVTDEELKAQARKRWEKEHPEEYQRQLDESIKRQQKELLLAKYAPPPVPVEGDGGDTPEDFMARL